MGKPALQGMRVNQSLLKVCCLCVCSLKALASNQNSAKHDLWSAVGSAMYCWIRSVCVSMSISSISDWVCSVSMSISMSSLCSTGFLGCCGARAVCQGAGGLGAAGVIMTAIINSSSLSTLSCSLPDVHDVTLSSLYFVLSLDKKWQIANILLYRYLWYCCTTNIIAKPFLSN